MKKILGVILSIVLMMAFTISCLGFASIAVKSIKLNSSNIKLQVGKTYTLKVTITPTNASNKKLTYASANKNVATVDKNGKIAGINAGKTIITVTSSSNKKAVAKCNVTVEKVAPVKLVLWQQGWAKPMGDPGNIRTKKLIDKALNIDIQLVVAPPDKPKDKLNLMLASGDQLDILSSTLGMSDLLKDYNNGGIARLNELIDKYGKDIKRFVPSENWKLDSADDGSIIMIPNANFGDQNYFIVRNDLLKKYNMTTPKTLTEFEAYLEQAKNDNGMIPLDYNYNHNNDYRVYKAIGGMFLKNGFPGDPTQGSAVGYDANGKLVDIIRVPGFKDIISRMASWYSKGYIPKDLISWTNDKRLSMYAAGKVAGIIGAATQGFAPAGYPIYFKDHPDAYFVYCDPMVGPKGTNAGTKDIGINDGPSIPANSKVKDTAIKYLNWLLADADNYMTVVYGEKDVDWSWVDKSTYTFKTLKSGLPACTCSFYEFDYYGYMIKDVASSPRDTLYLNSFAQFATHVKLVPPNPFKVATRSGLFADVSTQNNVTDLNDFKDQEIQKFIDGTNPMSEWDNFIKEYLKRGGQALDDARNDVWVKNKAKMDGN